MTFWWQNDRYNIERLNVGPADEILGITTRNDNLYEAGAGLTWEFARGWSFNPEILYIRDQSNILAVNYSSTEIWITLRGVARVISDEEHRPIYWVQMVWVLSMRGARCSTPSSLSWRWRTSSSGWCG